VIITFTVVPSSSEAIAYCGKIGVLPVGLMSNGPNVSGAKVCVDMH